MLKLKSIFIKISFLGSLFFFISCTGGTLIEPTPNVNKSYTENIYGKRKQLFSEYDTGKKYERGSFNVSLTYISNLNPIKDVDNDRWVVTNVVNTTNTFYQNSTIYETKNTTNIRLSYQYSNSIGIGLGASISNGNNDAINNPHLLENITEPFFSLRYGQDLDKNTHAIIGASWSKYNLKSSIEIFEENHPLEIYSYATDYVVPNNKLMFTLNRKLNKYNHIFIGAQRINRIYKLIGKKNMESYDLNDVYVQEAIQSHSYEIMYYGYLGWETSINTLSQRNTLSICLGYPFFNEKPINEGVTLGMKLTSNFQLSSPS